MTRHIGKGTKVHFKIPDTDASYTELTCELLRIKPGGVAGDEQRVEPCLSSTGDFFDVDVPYHQPFEMMVALGLSNAGTTEQDQLWDACLNGTLVGVAIEIPDPSATYYWECTQCKISAFDPQEITSGGTVSARIRCVPRVASTIESSI